MINLNYEQTTYNTIQSHTIEDGTIELTTDSGINYILIENLISDPLSCHQKIIDYIFYNVDKNICKNIAESKQFNHKCISKLIKQSDLEVINYMLQYISKTVENINAIAADNMFIEICKLKLTNIDVKLLMRDTEFNDYTLHAINKLCSNELYNYALNNIEINVNILTYLCVYDNKTILKFMDKNKIDINLFFQYNVPINLFGVDKYIYVMVLLEIRDKNIINKILTHKNFKVENLYEIKTDKYSDMTNALYNMCIVGDVNIINKIISLKGFDYKQLFIELTNESEDYKICPFYELCKKDSRKYGNIISKILHTNNFNFDLLNKEYYDNHGYNNRTTCLSYIFNNGTDINYILTHKNFKIQSLFVMDNMLFSPLHIIYNEYKKYILFIESYMVKHRNLIFKYYTKDLYVDYNHEIEYTIFNVLVNYGRYDIVNKLLKFDDNFDALLYSHGRASAFNKLCQDNSYLLEKIIKDSRFRYYRINVIEQLYEKGIYTKTPRHWLIVNNHIDYCFNLNCKNISKL